MAQTHTVRKLWFYVFLPLLLLAHGQSYGQQSKQYSFTHYGASAGLSSNEVLNSVQDDQGYIWIATTNGLQRFDGNRYRTFIHDKNDPSSIPDNYIYELFQDSKKNLWILTGKGNVGIFDSRTFKFKSVKITPVKETNLRNERKLIEDEEGNIMLLIAATELLTYNPSLNELSPRHNFIPLANDIRVTDIKQEQGTKKYWIGTYTGLRVYNTNTKQFSYAGKNTDKEILIDRYGKLPGMFNLFFDSYGRFWFNSWKGGVPLFYSYDMLVNKPVLNEYSLISQLLTYHECRGFFQQKDGTVWAYGLGVLAEFMEYQQVFQAVYNGYLGEQSILYERVNSISEDREKNLWVSTNNNGIYRFNPEEQFFTNIPYRSRVTGKPGDGSVLSFMELRNGNILMSAWGEGLYLYSPRLDTIPLKLGGRPVDRFPFAWCMAASGDSNTIWMGAQPGIWEMNQSKMTMTKHSPKVLEGRTNTQVVEDPSGNLWIGNHDIGLFKWKSARKLPRNTDSIIAVTTVPKCQITKILIDKKGLVWVGTNGFGVYVLDPVTDKLVMHFGTTAVAGKKMVSDVISTIHEYDDSTMVIGAQNIYIYNQRSNQMQGIVFPESITGAIAAMERDKVGYLWISLSTGILRLNINKRIFIKFDRIDGILNDRFTLAASRTMSDGRIFLGASNQFVAFHPERIQINMSTPDIVVTDFKLLNESLLVDSLLSLDKIILSSKQNSLSIEFSGLNYINSYLIRYKMEGLDEDWRIADKNNQAIYSYLPPGNYTFLLRSEDAEGNPGKHITRLEIQIKQPFWRTWWFYSLLVLMVVGILYYMDRERIRQIKDLQQVRTEIATNLHEDVNATLNNINLLGEMAKIKADRDIERSKEYIDQISTKSHNMIIAMDDILWSIDPQNDSMEKTLLRMMEFTDALKNRHNAEIQLSLDKKVRSLKLDMKTRHEFFLIFKIGLRMIIEQARGQNTLINIDLFRNKLSMKIQDATAKLDANIPQIESSIREINSRAVIINADSDIQYDKNGIAIILMIAVRN